MRAINAYESLFGNNGEHLCSWQDLLAWEKQALK